LVLNDNVGGILAGMCRQPSTALKQISIQQLTNLYTSSGDIGKFNRRFLRQAQVGKGTTPATRATVGIETPFSSAPENGFVNSNDMGYISGLGKAESGTLISNTGGSGTITEVVRAFRLSFPAGGGSFIQGFFMRDVINGVSFVNGQSINITHEVLI